MAVLNQANGLFFYLGWPAVESSPAADPIAPLNPGSIRPATLSSVTDGLSNTFAFGEKAHGKFSQTPDVNYSIDYQYNGAWVSGGFGDTLFTTLYPMNPFNRIGDDPNGDYFYSYDAQQDNFSIAASSFHPGGCNFGFLDGSVRFVKETVSTWPYNTSNGTPTNVSYNPSTGLFTASPAPGVYQATSTRSGGEVVGSRSVLIEQREERSIAWAFAQRRISVPGFRSPTAYCLLLLEIARGDDRESLRIDVLSEGGVHGLGREVVDLPLEIGLEFRGPAEVEVFGQDRAEPRVVGPLVLLLPEITVLGGLELRDRDAVLEEAIDFLDDAGLDLLDVDRVLDREDHEGGVGVEGIGGEHRHGVVGDPVLLAEAIGDPRREAAAAKDVIAHDQGGIIGIAVLDREHETGDVDGIGLVGRLDRGGLRLQCPAGSAARSRV